MKECTRCHMVLPATNEYFRNFAKAPDGLTWYCKSCLRNATKEARLKKLSQYRFRVRYNNYLRAGYQKTRAYQLACKAYRTVLKEDALKDAEMAQAYLDDCRPEDPVRGAWTMAEDDWLIQHLGRDADLRAGVRRLDRVPEDILSRCAILSINERGADWRAHEDFLVPEWAKVSA